MNAETDTAYGWTANEIRARLGISSAVFEKERLGAREIARIGEAGIRYIELAMLPLDLRKMPRSVDHRDERQIQEIRAACAANGIQIVAVHSPNLPYSAEDESERRSAVREGVAIARVAVELGASLVVCHFRSNDSTRRSIHDLLHRTAAWRVTLGAENLTDDNSIRKVLALLQEFDSPRLRMVLDIGHETDSHGMNPFTLKGLAKRAVVQCVARLAHVHLHDVLAHTFARQPDTRLPLRHRDHQPPLHEDGMIQWGEVFLGLRDINYPGVLLFEDGLCDDPQGFIDATVSFPDRFLARYRSHH